MELNRELIQKYVFQGMDEGVLVIQKDGRILMVNAKAEEILEKKLRELEGLPIAAFLFENEKNDDFNQVILDAIYDSEHTHREVVPYYGETVRKYLNVVSSGLRIDEKLQGVILVFSDITELTEVREHLKMMRQIEELNQQLKSRNRFIRKTFGRYLSDDIVNNILDTPDGIRIGGNMENITVLMSDLRGFTALCEQVQPDILMDMLNHYFDKMGSIIKEQNGTIIEYMGDGILSIFGAPVKTSNHAVDAVVAALKMQQSMEEINQWNEERGYPFLKMGIGINTGDAVVGNMGSEYAMKYNVIGSCVNLCGRIESYTVDGQIFISPSTRCRIPHELEIDQKLNIIPKGVQEPLDIYSVQGIGAPYHVMLKRQHEEMILLDRPIRVSLFTMEGKHVSELPKEATIKGMSLKRIWMKTEEELQIFDNILLKDEKGRSFYCKVSKKRNQEYLLSITGNA